MALAQPKLRRLLVNPQHRETVQLQFKVDPNSDLVVLSPVLFSLFLFSSFVLFFPLLSLFSFPLCHSFLQKLGFFIWFLFFCKMPLFLLIVNYAELFLRTVLNKRSSNGIFFLWASRFQPEKWFLRIISFCLLRYLCYTFCPFLQICQYWVLAVYVLSLFIAFWIFLSNVEKNKEQQCSI